MAMTITDAAAVNTLLRWIAKVPRDSGPVTDQEAHDAAVTLAEHAHKALMAGWGGDQVREHWPNLPCAARIEDGVVVCGSCGSKEFQYEESVPSERAMASNEDHALVFNGCSREFDGDDDPGVVCANCETPAELPSGVVIDWR